MFMHTVIKAAELSYNIFVVIYLFLLVIDFLEVQKKFNEKEGILDKSYDIDCRSGEYNCFNLAGPMFAALFLFMFFHIMY